MINEYIAPCLIGLAGGCAVHLWITDPIRKLRKDRLAEKAKALAQEKISLEQARKLLVCPDCEWHLFYRGPSGGASINVQCASCHQTWNWMGVFGFQKIDSPSNLFDGMPMQLEDM